MTSSTRPVLIGTAQFSERALELETAPTPLDMLVRIANESAESSGAGSKLLKSLDTIGFTNIMGWAPTNGPDLLASALGIHPSTMIVSAVGGETSLGLMNALAERIARGESQLALVAGCNNFRTLGLARKAKIRLDWPMGGDGEPTPFGKDKWGANKAEEAVGLNMPIAIYPLFENGLRAARGQSLAEHQRAMGELFAPFTSVAAKNPHAWFPTERSSAELTEPTPVNRMIGFPYPKYLNAVMTTDQAAGALIASEDMARRLGIPESDWIYWRGGALEIEDPWFVSDRPSFSESPSLANCHRRAFAGSGLDLDDFDLFDFYSCFPSAVAMACEMLGLAPDDPRGLTLTGGLPYAGGPGNSYSLHAVASAVEALRDCRGQHAFLTGNGWYLTKHSATILSREPGPPNPLAAQSEAANIQRVQWKTKPPKLVSNASGSGTVETYTVIHGRDGQPETGIIIGRLDDTGERFLANTPNDLSLLAGLEKIEVIGTTGQVEQVEGKTVFHPN